MVIGSIGGFSGMIWSAVLIIIGPYEAFTYTASQVSEIYPINRRQIGHQNVNDAKNDLKESLDTLGRYHYTFLEMIFASVIKKFCCFFKKFKCYKKRNARLSRHQAAEERLSKELDVFSVLKLLRLTEFISMVRLKRY